MEWLKALFQFMTRLFGTNPKPGNWPDTVGPPLDENPAITVMEAINLSTRVNHGQFEKGWWTLATAKPMHTKRLGRGIIPKTLIVHTTDCKPGTFATIVKSWTTTPGKGNGAHFIIGKTEKDGVVQFAPIMVNANHAGGPNCGGIKLPGGAIVNPNACSVGVELDNAGRLKKDTKGWYHPDTGYRFSAEDVFVDEKGRGWEKLTQYQEDTLYSLWNALKSTLSVWPWGTTVAPNDSYEKHSSTWAKSNKPSLIGHASTNPINKTDPGPQVMEIINKWV